MDNGNNAGRSGYRPSSTNPQFKVCMSPGRFDIEVALAQGQPQETIARRFSQDGRAFSRQNVPHYHRHMQVIDRAVLEAATCQLADRATANWQAQWSAIFDAFEERVAEAGGPTGLVLPRTGASDDEYRVEA